MKLDAHAHLTYCSNIHPAQTWEEVRAALALHVPQIRERLGHRGAFGLGLRLSAQAARALRAPDALSAFREWMAEEDAYVFTLNGFPYGPFHGTPVKQSVYRPDWSTAERCEYTADLIHVLTQLVPEGVEGSISTVPGGFRHDPGARQPETMARNLVAAAHDCWQHAQRSGTRLCVALEPEPMCMLETTEEAASFFCRHLFSKHAVEHFVRLAGCTRSDAERALHAHLGVCFDTCHAAVEYEDPRAGPARLEAEGIRIAKVQVTAGLELHRPDAQGLARLEAFAEDVYLHQVVIRAPDGLVRLLDLPEALSRARRGALPDGPWRVHLHVPVFSELEPPLRATTQFIRDAMPDLRARSHHFEVETYTWDVLPPSLRTRSLDASVAEELRWASNTWHSA
ncbi:MAG: metabolite traffic protein EboE [Nannocystaceae bacterium]|nr:metabolite traffic protein EboE [bacterium]